MEFRNYTKDELKTMKHLLGHLLEFEDTLLDTFDDMDDEDSKGNGLIITKTYTRLLLANCEKALWNCSEDAP